MAGVGCPLCMRHHEGRAAWCRVGSCVGMAGRRPLVSAGVMDERPMHLRDIDGPRTSLPELRVSMVGLRASMPSLRAFQSHSNMYFHAFLTCITLPMRSV